MSNNYLQTEFQNYIHLSRYARWKNGRRETWTETVSRYFDFFSEHLAENYNFNLTKELRKELEEGVLDLKVMPSMRALMTAGPALKRDNIAGYNCAYIPVDRTTSFDEILYILMNGTGVGFSVERQYISKLPEIAEQFHKSDIVIHVADSKLGWAKALKELISLLYGGQIPTWDVSKVRGAGEPLKTFGGRASGPEPLEDLFRFVVEIFKNAAGRKLTSIECHDVVCKIAEIVVVGGVRRSALISLSNLSDDRMRAAKSGKWWEINVQRALANNSVAYTEKPDMGIFMDEWKSLYDSKSGERGIFSRIAAVKQVEKVNAYRQNLLKTDVYNRVSDIDFGCNPCSEILLRPYEFCNLTEIIARASDSIKILKEKVRLAAILGTIQSTLTNFKYISKRWKDNCEEERLLGVSLTGIMDNEFTNGKAFENRKDFEKFLNDLKDVAIKTNIEMAKLIGINPSKSVTCVKPSGTVSSLVDSASGIHARHNPFYIRTVRGDKKDPITQMMVDAGFPVEDDITKKDHTSVFSFPFKAPKGGVTRNDMTAIEQLEMWKVYQLFWCEHKPSITVSVKEHEWLEVGAWVYKNFDIMSGVSFLPFSDHTYKQAPYQDCTEEEYNALLAKMPKNVDWSKLSLYEDADMTTGSQELACSGPQGCEVI